MAARVEMAGCFPQVALTMLYRSNPERVLWPLNITATRSGTPLRTHRPDRGAPQVVTGSIGKLDSDRVRLEQERISYACCGVLSANSTPPVMCQRLNTCSPGPSSQV